MKYIKQFIYNLDENFEIFVDKYLLGVIFSILIIIAAYFLKGLVLKIIASLLKRRYGEEKKSKAEAINKIVRPPLSIFIMTCAITLCIYVLKLSGHAYAIAINTVQSLLIIAGFSILYGFSGYCKYVLEKTSIHRGETPDMLTINFISTLIKVVVIVFGALTVFQQWIDNITSLIAGLSIGGVAIALAAQDTASNFFGAITVMFDNPFEQGDYIEVNGVEGTVERMGLRSTRIRRSDRTVVVVPNSKMSSENIVNWTMLDKRRIELEMGIEYSTPALKIKEFTDKIKEHLCADEDVLNDGIIVIFKEFSDSSLTLYVRYYTKKTDYIEMMELKGRINLELTVIAEKLGVSFAYPARTVYLKNYEEKN